MLYGGIIIMAETLKDRARSLKCNIEMVAISPGYVDTGEDSRHLYEAWAEINRECISSGSRDVADDCSFVDGQLRRLLDNWPAGKTTFGVLEVFPQCGGSPFVFGRYLCSLEQVAMG